MRLCEDCKGAIADQGDVLGGYSGKWCTCDVPYHRKLMSVDDMLKNMKGDVKKPSFSHILNLCEQLSMNELAALISVLTTMVKK